MKKYIYIDTNLLNSLLADNNPYGIKSSNILSTQSEISEENSNSSTEPSTSTEYGVDAKLFKYLQTIHDEINSIKYSITNKNSATEQSSYRIHSINLFKQYLELEDSLKNEIEKVTDAFSYVDLNGISDFANSIFTGNISKTIFGSNGRNKGSNKKDLIQTHINNEERKNIEFGLTALELIKKLLPSPIYLENSKYYIPLDSDNFLYNQELVNYIFKENTTIVGIPCNKLGTILNSGNQNMILDLDSQLKSIIMESLSLLGYDLEKEVMIPIGWYQE